jgi:hypothetical protein
MKGAAGCLDMGTSPGIKIVGYPSDLVMHWAVNSVNRGPGPHPLAICKSTLNRNSIVCRSIPSGSKETP